MAGSPEGVREGILMAHGGGETAGRIKFVLLGVAVAVILIGGTAGAVLALTHRSARTHRTVSNREAMLGTGPVTDTAPTNARSLSITALPPAGGKGGGWGDDYPANLKDAPQDSIMDPWREWNRECTSFAAWALHSRNGFEMPFYGDANTWGSQAKARGFTVNGAPAAGAIAWEIHGDQSHG